MAIIIMSKPASKLDISTTDFNGPTEGNRADPVTLASFCWALALLTEMYRNPMAAIAGPLGRFEGRRASASELLGMVSPAALGRLAAFREVFATTLLPSLGQRAGRWLLGPTFAGSALMKADADLIAAGLLLDLKTESKLSLGITTVFQVIGYALLDFDDGYQVTSAGTFSARYAHLATWEIGALLDELAGCHVDLPAIRQEFRQLLLACQLSATGSFIAAASRSASRVAPDWRRMASTCEDEERRFLVRAELDAAFFHLYGIDRDDVDYIMETFPIVKRKGIAAHGTYRTKDRILEIYDAMAKAKSAGADYQTELTPPPRPWSPEPSQILQVDSKYWVVARPLARYCKGVVLSARFGELDEAPLARSPIVSVVWQLRFEEHPALAAPETVLRLQEFLGGPDEFAIALLPKIQLSVQASGPAVENMPMPAAGAAGGGWRLSAKDGSWHLSADSASLAIEAARYGTWEGDFLPRLQRVLGSLKEVGNPVLESRLGLRYVNVLTGSAVGKPPISAPGELAGLVAPWLLGPLNEPHLQDSVQVSQGRVVLSLEHANAILNHGVISTETHELGYLIDIDAFREGGRAFRVDDIMVQTETLHAAALGLFQLSLTSEALEAMRSAPSTDTAG